FIEPIELLELNNHISELQQERRLEIIALLKEMTNRIRPSLTEIARAIQQMAFFDFIRAKARLASEYKWQIPALSHNLHKITGAVHPLLYIRLKEENKTAVKLDFQLDKEQRIMVISGPNAGGKSVALKTAGLL